MRTRITNNTGSDRYFGFIPTHGEKLQNGQSVLLEGDLATVLAGGRNRYARPSELQSFRRLVNLGRILIESVPDAASSSSSSA